MYGVHNKHSSPTNVYISKRKNEGADFIIASLNYCRNACSVNWYNQSLAI
jgi:hypothetical protein